ncbi:hypothetical protein NL676_014365 [Syzygium grande]|nr:hypothetical protein NL676_014365 [Syzygium grande]
MAVNLSSTSASMAAASFQIKCLWPRDSGSNCHSHKLETPSTRLLSLSLSIHGLESSQLGPPRLPAQQMAAMVKQLYSSSCSRLELELCGYGDGETPD